MASIIRYEYSASTKPPEPTESSSLYTSALSYPVGGGYYCAKKWDEGQTVVTRKSFEKEWTPADGTLALWLDANDESTITKDGSNLVSQWNDKSGNGRNATASGSQRPTWNASKIINDGSSNYMSFPRVSNIRCAIVLHKWAGTTGDYRSIIGDSENQPAFHGTESSNGQIISTSWASSYVINGNKYLNGTLASGGINKPTSISTVIFETTANVSVNNIASDRNFGRYFWGDYLEIILLDYVPDTTLRQKIEGYLAWRWDGINGNTALVTALPSNHAHKSAPPT